MVLAALTTLALVSCSKESPQQTAAGSEVELRIVPTVVEAASGDIGVVTRAKVDEEDGKFPVGTMIGLGISAPAASPAIASFYDNFYASYDGGVWRYYLNNINAGTTLSGFSNWNTIALYGYYPYDPAATDLGAVPFSIATLNGGVGEGSETTALTDYMVAGTRTKDMNTASGEVTLQFGHMMTAIELYINRISSITTSNPALPILKLGSVTFEIVTGTRKFVISGTYTAINPDMTDMQNNINPAGRTTATKMTITYPSSPTITYSSNSALITPRLLVIMPELRQNSMAGNEDATVRLTFSFTDQDGSPYLLENIAGGKPSVEFNLSAISNSGTTDKGLLAGYSYGIKATVGTYTHFAAPTTGSPTPPHINDTPITDAAQDEFIDI
jgi:hypothetical protein